MQNANLFNFTLLLVDFGKVSCPSVNAFQQNSNASSGEEYTPQILTVLLWIHHVCIWPLWPFVFCLSFLNNSYVSTPSSNKGFWPDIQTDFTSSVWNFCRWVADVPPRETSPAARSEEKRLFSQLRSQHLCKFISQKKRLHKKRVQLPQEWFGTLTWPPVSWRHVKTLNCFFMP